MPPKRKRNDKIAEQGSSAIVESVPPPLAVPEESEPPPRNPYKKKKKKKKPYEQDPASSDSSDLEYPEVRRKALEDYNIRTGKGIKTKKKKRGRKPKIQSEKHYDVIMPSNEVVFECENAKESSNTLEKKDAQYYGITGDFNPLRKISPEYVKYRRTMDSYWKLKEEEERMKKIQKQKEMKEFLPERYQKTGAAPKMIHPLKFICHGHNRHHALTNDPVPSVQREYYQKAISMGKAKTVDAFLIYQIKEGNMAESEKEIYDLVHYARNRVQKVIKQDMLYMPPNKPVYDDGTRNSVRIGMDIQRFTLSCQGFARMNPIMDQFSRHIISPETSSKERSKRMSEGVIDAVDRDLQDMPKFKKIEAREQKAMKSLKKSVVEYMDTSKETFVRAEDILCKNDLREKITPLLEVLHNNQHPGLRRNRDFFAEAVQNILQKREQQKEKQQYSSLGENTKAQEGKKNEFSVSSRLSTGNSQQKTVFGYPGYSNTPGYKELKNDPYILNLMKSVPIKYTEPLFGEEITVGHRLVPVKEGETGDTDDKGNPLSPVPLPSFPFKLKGDDKSQMRMMRSLRKMKDESLLPEEEYKNVFLQEMAPKEPTIEALFSIENVASRGNNSVPTNRLGQKIRRVGFNESNRRSGTSLLNAEKKMKSNKEGEEEGKHLSIHSKYEGEEEKEEPTQEEIQKSIEKAKRERMEDQNIMCPQLPNYKEDTKEDEEPSATDPFVFNRKSCIMHLAADIKKKQQEFEWMFNAYTSAPGVDDILQNPDLYDGAGGEGIIGLGEACSKEYIADFLREPVGSERACCNGKKCMGVILPLLKNWPDSLDVTSSEGGPILREFYRPEQLKKIMGTLKYPETLNPCVLCIDFVTTQACYSFASNDTAPKCVIQYYWVKGYPKKVLFPLHSSRKYTPTGIILPCKIFRIQDYFLTTTDISVNGKWIKVRCYEERIYTEDEVGSGGIAGLTLDGQPITNKDFWEASVVSVNQS